jgi:VanZ family protein
VPASRPINFWLPVLVWMGVIGSTARTSRIIGPILRFFKPDVTQLTIDTWQIFVRKCAHLGEYAVLAVLLAPALARRPLLPFRPHSPRIVLLALLYCFLYALSDEIHQRFVSSRESAFRDVIIDTIGATSGLVILQLLARWPRRSS